MLQHRTVSHALFALCQNVADVARMLNQDIDPQTPISQRDISRQIDIWTI